MSHVSRHRTLAVLLLVVLAALVLRLILLAGPKTQLEADEAIVGLMARHILEGERPVFYYMQPYLGSLEAYLVAGVFALVDSSTFALKFVPLTASLAFVCLVFATGHRLGGLPAAAIAGLYAAVPPAFLAVWGLKARGGYIETLVLGQLLILLAIRFSSGQPFGFVRGGLFGFIAGLGVWVNPLIVVYLVPAGIYMLLSMRRRVLGSWMGPAVLGCLLGAFPLIDFNLRNDFATAQAMFGGGGGLADAPVYLYQFFRVSLPVLVGVAQASSSPDLFWPTFWAGPAANWPIVVTVGGGFVLLVLLNAKSLFGLVAGRSESRDGRSLLALLLLVVPAVFVLSRFRELVTEPRYLLPLYSSIPLIGIGISASRLPRSEKALLVALLLALNVHSVAVLDPRLTLPDTAIGSTAQNRSELTAFLLGRGIDRVYTDYWIAYPLAFESEERVVPSVISGGFNRYIPYAHKVSISENPAFVFISGSTEEKSFRDKLAVQRATASREQVSIYSVYSRVDPLDAIRP